jgi:hypothetical protein
MIQLADDGGCAGRAQGIGLAFELFREAGDDIVFGVSDSRLNKRGPLAPVRLVELFSDALARCFVFMTITTTARPKK